MLVLKDYTHICGLSIQGLCTFSGQKFKDFLRTFQDPTLDDNFTSKPRNICKPDMRCALVAKHSCTKVMRENTGNENTSYHTFHEYFQSALLFLPEYLFSLDFIYFKALKADIFNLVQ